MKKSKCTKKLYQSFLEVTSVRYSGKTLSEISPIDLSHDSVSRWLKSQNFRPRGIWKESKKYIDLEKEYFLIGDDTVIEKERSAKLEIAKRLYSGNKHRVINGIGLVNLIAASEENKSFIPVDYRIYDKQSDSKTKNDHFIDMIHLAKERGLKPKAVLFDTWYSGLDNLKAIKKCGINWVTGLRKNRIVNKNEELQNIFIPDEGRIIYLRGYGTIRVFRFESTKRRTDYFATSFLNITREQIRDIMKIRWAVEVYHRELKQNTGISRCQAHTGRAQRNHIFLSISAWLAIFVKRKIDSISSYKIKWDIISGAIAQSLAIAVKIQ